MSCKYWGSFYLWCIFIANQLLLKRLFFLSVNCLRIFVKSQLTVHVCVWGSMTPPFCSTDISIYLQKCHTALIPLCNQCWNQIVKAPTPFLKFVLVILNYLSFHIKLRISLSITKRKELAGILIRVWGK